MDKWTHLNVLILIFLSASLGVLGYYAQAVPAPSIGATVEPGSLASGCDFIIYSDGASYLAKNCQTGANSYSGTVASTVIENALGTTGGHLHFKGSISITVGITWDLTADGDKPVKFTGDGRDRTILTGTGAFSIFDFTGTAGDSLDNIYVGHMTINGGGFTAANGAIRCRLVYGCIMEDLKVTAGGGIGITFDGGEGHRLLTSQVNAFANAGVNINSASVYMAGNDVFGNADQGGNGDVQLGGAERTEIIGNWFGGGSRAALFIGGTSTFVKVIGNFLYNSGLLATNTYDTLHVEASSNITVIGNTIMQDYGSAQANKARYGLAISNDAPYNIFVDNVFLGPFGTSKVGIFNGGTALGERLESNTGYNPVGKITNFVVSGSFAPWGTSSTVVASTTYTLTGIDMLITSTGGTSVSINVACGGNNYVAAATTLTNQLVWIGCTVNFGAFSVAPTVTVFGN